MAKLSVLDKKGKKVSDIELNDDIFAIEPNKSAMHLVVVAYLAAQRQGTQSTLTRAEVSGGGKKPWRQKGSGRARQGSTRSPQWTHGGIAHGPKPRDYRFKLNKKVKSLARVSALSYKAQENAITIVEPFAMDAPKTKEFLGILDALKAGSRKVLFVLPENSNNIFLSSRNLPEVKVITVDEINTYTIMNANSMVLVDGVQDILASRVNR